MTTHPKPQIKADQTINNSYNKNAFEYRDLQERDEMVVQEVAADVSSQTAPQIEIMESDTERIEEKKNKKKESRYREVQIGKGVTMQDVTRSETLQNKKRGKLMTFSQKHEQATRVIKFDPKILDMLSSWKISDEPREEFASYGMTKLGKKTIIDTGANVFATSDESDTTPIR